MLTLGIETSCDETAVAVVEDGARVLSNVILSQTEHTRFGGVVPEIASRAHVAAITQICEEALEGAGAALSEIELVAATRGPGLVGCLLVGLNFAKGLALAGNMDFAAVNHLEGHIAANFLNQKSPIGRHVSLVISGGHTLLVEVRGFGEYRLLGRTRDDAVGEAFDKVAKLLGLGYPGGAKIDRLSDDGDPSAIRFPRPMGKSADYDFSFSGLKTAVSLHWLALSEVERRETVADVAASFQEAAVDILVSKTVRAARELGVSLITLSGGVAANRRLREAFIDELSRMNVALHAPEAKLCTDNAAMIAAAGHFQFLRQGPSSLNEDADPSLRLA